MICGDTQAHARMWDVGLDGLCLLTKRPMSPGTRCTTSCELPINGVPTPITVQVRVVYSSFSGPDGFKLGMVFLDLREDVADLITRFLAAG